MNGYPLETVVFLRQKTCQYRGTQTHNFYTHAECTTTSGYLVKLLLLQNGRIQLGVTGLLKVSHAHLRSSIAVTYRSAPSRMRIREYSLDTRLTVWRTLVENVRLVAFLLDEHVCHNIYIHILVAHLTLQCTPYIERYEPKQCPNRDLGRHFQMLIVVLKAPVEQKAPLWE